MCILIALNKGSGKKIFNELLDHAGFLTNPNIVELKRFIFSAFNKYKKVMDILMQHLQFCSLNNIDQLHEYVTFLANLPNNCYTEEQFLQVTDSANVDALFKIPSLLPEDVYGCGLDNATVRHILDILKNNLQ